MRDVKDLRNQHFGRWTVLDDCILVKNKKNKTERKWLCRCECGAEKYVLERSLLYGGSKSCGCIKAENHRKTVAYDLRGNTFGEFKVLCIAADHIKDTRGGIWWRCRCSCGNETEVLASLLVTGRKRHCGCKTKPQYAFEDIKEKTFGRLTAKYPLSDRDRKGSVIWHCECSCGKEVNISYNTLMYTDVRSCGCQKKEHDQLLPSFLTRIDGTSLDIIKSKKIPSDNTSGVKGVYFQKGKWLAKIVFQQKQYHLGRYDTIEEATNARKAAEELLFDGAAAHYESWKVKADADPEWAKNHPVQILVSKKTTSELAVTFLPVIA